MVLVDYRSTAVVKCDGGDEQEMGDGQNRDRS
jgi:hypothetical protein